MNVACWIFLNVIFFNSDSDFNSVTTGSRHTMVATGRWLRRTEQLHPVVVNCVKISGVPRSGIRRATFGPRAACWKSRSYSFSKPCTRPYGKRRTLGTSIARTYVGWNISRGGISTIFFAQKSTDYFISWNLFSFLI